MSSTGVLPFVRGVDFSRNNFQEAFPEAIGTMTGIQWLKLDSTDLTVIPKQVASLQKLEHLSLKSNRLERLYGELTDLNCLRALNLRRNHVKASGIPTDLFTLDDLNTLDLSWNTLKEVPEGLEKAKGLLVLNLSNNSINSIPNSLFIHLTDLLFLDLSTNNLETLPPQTRRLINLQTLILDNNPLGHFQLRQLPSLTNLNVLSMRNTQRNLGSFPPNLGNLANLVEIDLAGNALNCIPEALYAVPNLKRLNLSENCLSEVSAAIDMWQELDTLNVSQNQLVALPASLCRLGGLRRLYLNDNRLTFDGIPAGIGKLGMLEVFSASHNQLEMIPEGLCRCGSLKKLNLSWNRLVTLPDTIHLITDFIQLDISNNPDLVMPPRPQDFNSSLGDGLAYYNIDFSLQNQLRLAGANVPPPITIQNSSKDPIARKLRLRRSGRRDHEEADQDQAKILRGMKDIANNDKNDTNRASDQNAESLKPKRWDETLEKPPLDYSEFFEENDGRKVGLTVWEIENFLPNRLNEVAYGKFYEGDCYIVLKTFLDPNQSLDWQIFFWIGKKAPVDKKACAAIHAVNLRNFLGAQCRTVREEEADESDEFLNLFDSNITYIEGGRTCSGFYTVEDNVFEGRLYRVHANGPTIHLELVGLAPTSLDPRFVFILDAGTKIFIWFGVKARLALKCKAQLMCEKINKNERKSRAELVVETMQKESREFWSYFVDDDEEEEDEEEEEDDEDDDNSENEIEKDRDGENGENSEFCHHHEFMEHVANDFTPLPPRLYQVQLGMGYLELPQVAMSHRKLEKTLLDSKNVYILDCFQEVFVWFGRKSTRLVNAAAIKLSDELYHMIKRPSFAQITQVRDGNEPQIFKSKFSGWDEVIAVDFTRTAASVQKTGANLSKWAASQQTRVDLTALFTPRQQAMSLAEAQQLTDEWNDDLDAMEALVLDGKRFVRLPEEELGHFYSMDCYVFLCRYWVPTSTTSATANGAGSPPPKNCDDDSDDIDGQCRLKDPDVEEEEDFQCVVYFWQGRDASNMGWLTFTFTLQKKFKMLFGAKLEVIRTYQQQENMKFMAHFKRKFIIHQGRRRSTATAQNDDNSVDQSTPNVEFYHLRSNGSALYTRLVQITPDASLLNSGFCYILRVPFEQDASNSSGVVYVWIGSRADPDEVRLVHEIAETMFNSAWVSLQIVQEGEEPDNFFWVGLGGRKAYAADAEFMQYTRLFRCSNEKGYFVVSEKCSDFCQDDLADDDIMLLDNGDQVYLWLGAKCSEIEMKLAYKSAQVYIQHMRVQQADRPRTLFVTLKNKESKRFTKCFHGWAAHKRILD